MLLQGDDLVFVPHLGTDAPLGALTSVGTPAGWTFDAATHLCEAVRDAAPCVTLAAPDAPGAPFIRASAREQGRAVTIQTPEQHPVSCVQWAEFCLPPARRADLGDTVLISGGLGGIGLSLAEHFLLLGLDVVLIDQQRPTQLPLHLAHRLGLLSRLGPLRIGTPDTVKDAVRGWRPIDHFVACAGRATLAVASQFDPQALFRYATHKSVPFRALLDVLASRGLRSVVAYGSAESRKAHAHFGAYALANELLRAEAARQRAEKGIQIVVAEWSLWSGVGIGADQARLAEQNGFATIDPGWGAAATSALLAYRPDQPWEVVLGGHAAHIGAPLRAVYGVGGSTIRSDLYAADRLRRICQPDGIVLPQLSWTPRRAGARALSGPKGVTLTTPLAGFCLPPTDLRKED